MSEHGRTEAAVDGPVDWGGRPKSPREHGLLRPFTDRPEKWEYRVRRQEKLLAATGVQAEIHEHTGFGWLSWAPEGLAVPQQPVRIGILPPDAPRTARLARRWLTRGPARSRPVGSMAAIASLVVLGYLLRTGAPVSIAIAVALLIPVCVKFLPRHLDAAARRRVRLLEAPSPYIVDLQQFVVRHQHVTAAHARAPIPELDQAVGLSHHLLWDCATLLQTRPGPATDRRLQTYQPPHALLVDQALHAATAHAEKEFVLSLPPIPHTHAPEGPDPLPDEGLLNSEALADTARELNDLATATRYATNRLRPKALIPRTASGEEAGRPAAKPDWWRSYPAQG